MGVSGLNVLAVEPFLGGSHSQFLQGYRRYSEHAVRVLGLPGRHWKWRMQGGAMALARALEAGLSGRAGAPCARKPHAGGARAGRLQDGAPQALVLPAAVAPSEAHGVGAPQVLFASDMLDLPRFLGATHGALSDLPTVVYFHENQLTYPLPEGALRDLTYAWTNVETALLADRVFFNSGYHLREFLGALPGFLAELPDEVPAGLVDVIAEKSSVLHLGCDLRALDAVRPRSAAAGGSRAGRFGRPEDGPLIVWNQRWEYDKNPERFFEVLLALAAQGEPFRVAVAGAGYGTPSAAFADARRVLGERVVQWGRLDSREEYAALLWAADVVVSTASHEFFGAAAVEAVYCGCRPVLPRRLSYPELIPAEAQADVLYDEADLPQLLRVALRQPRAWSADWQRTWVARFDWGNMRGRYDDHIWSLWRTFGGARRPSWRE